jgi:hypothetical protein
MMDDDHMSYAHLCGSHHVVSADSRISFAALAVTGKLRHMSTATLDVHDEENCVEKAIHSLYDTSS